MYFYFVIVDLLERKENVVVDLNISERYYKRASGLSDFLTSGLLYFGSPICSNVVDALVLVR